MPQTEEETTYDKNLHTCSVATEHYLQNMVDKITEVLTVKDISPDIDNNRYIKALMKKGIDINHIGELMAQRKHFKSTIEEIHKARMDENPLKRLKKILNCINRWIENENIYSLTEGKLQGLKLPPLAKTKIEMYKEYASIADYFKKNIADHGANETYPA